MWIFKYGVPVLALLGFGHAVYEVFTGKIDAEKMGLEKTTLDMFGVANLFMVICWGSILLGLWAGAAVVLQVAYCIWL